MSVRHRLAAICITTTLVVGAGIPTFADDADPATTDASAPTTDAAPTTDEAPAPTTTEATEPQTDGAPSTTDETPITSPAETETAQASDDAAAVDGEVSSDAPADEVDDQAVLDRVTVQDIEVESVQIAISNTGSNESTSDVVSPSAGAEPGTDLATGSATALGSADATSIDQRVVTEVGGGSTIEVVQISIVFNIGGALANTGTNSLASGATGGGTGTISTGSATAVGNDSATYLTQGAGVQNSTGESVAVGQRTATLQIGVAIANSGSNAITSAAAGGGPASTLTGSASAVGNLASTAISQLVDVRATGGAHVSVEQRATIVNFGLAFADSGSNRIGTELAAALTSSDEAALEQLLMLLVPALVTSAELATGAGAIATGDATAIGNRSTTQVLQVAGADSAGGTVAIEQEVVVVNAGAAAATTGSNSIGSGLAAAGSLTSTGTQAVVGELASFLRLFLQDIERWASGTAVDLGRQALQTSLGGFDIGIDGTLAAQGASAGSSVTTRQLAAVVNLAIARANSGGNVATTTGGTAAATSTLRISDVATALSAPDVADALSSARVGAVLLVGDEDPMLIVTGDASASNSTLLVLCQRTDTPDLECLAPPAPPTDTPDPSDPGVGVASSPPDAAPTPRQVPAAPAPAAVVRQLPATGGDPRGLLLAAVAALLLGSTLLVVSRRGGSRRVASPMVGLASVVLTVGCSRIVDEGSAPTSVDTSPATSQPTAEWPPPTIDPEDTTMTTGSHQRATVVTHAGRVDATAVDGNLDVDVVSAAGWQSTVDRSGDQVLVEWTSGDRSVTVELRSSATGISQEVTTSG